MTIDTPAGTINQITPIREFVELTTITNAQYLLGIQNMSTGNGSKITFGNLITSLISGDANNKLVKGSDDKLFISTPIEIGTLDNLTTSNKTDLVSAINELNSNMGSLSDLETTVKTSLVAAINSVAELTEPELLIDKVNQSKALVTGNVAGYQEELEQLKLMKRSTFDRSKFTVVGSPVITSDGIASGFSSGNYLTTPNTINFSTAKTWSFKTKFNTGSAFSTIDQGVLSGDTVQNVQAIINNSGVLRGGFGDGTAWIWNLNPIAQLELNTDYILEMGYNGTAYYTKLNGVLKGSYLSDTKVSNTPIRLGVERTNGNFFTNGSFDLKQFSITVDGVEVFSGNKTGIDTIKPDNWTNKVRLFAYSDDTHTIYANNSTTPAVLYNSDGSYYIGSDFTVSGGKVYYGANECAYTSGSDIILTLTNTTVDAGCKVSNDGILTQFRSANYNLYKDLNISAFSNFEYDFSFVSGSVSGFFQHPDLATFISIWVNQAGGLTFALQKSGNVAVNNSFQTIDGLGNLTGKKVYVKIIFKNGFSEYRVKVENGEWKSVSFTSTDTSFTPYFSSLKFTSYTANTVTAYDLNDARFYNNGDLVYQPCLKILYTETSVQYGSKIVDVAYRDRVLDAYQQGYKDYKYYTLDEENGNFTLPHGELYGMLEQIRTENERNNEAVRQIVDVKDNLYKILEGHQSTNKALWDLITFTDNSEADNLLIGGDNPFTSNSSNSDFHFYLLNSIIGTNQPDDTAKLNIYKLFNKSHYDAQSDPIYVQDGTIVIACANPTKLSKILLRSYDTYYTTPSIIHIHGANIPNNMSRDITMTDFTSYAKYIGGISTTKEDTYTIPTNTNWGINRPIELTIDDKDTFNTFFISMSHWCSGQSGWGRRLVGVQVYGTQMTNDNSDYTVKMSGEYENCKWIASNGKIYNTDDLYQQYGYIPKEKAQLSRWISCFGSGIGQANATTRAADQYYPKYISGSISTTKNNGGQPWYFLRQTNYSAEPRPQVGYNVSGQGYLNITSTLNNQTVIDYTADSSFPIGEYYWEGTFGYNQSPTAHNGDTYMCGWCQLQKVYDDDSVEIIQTFSKEGSMYEPSVCYRTPRFYANRAFKKLRLIIKEMAYPNAAMILSQMQLYYRDTAGNIARSFIPNATQYDLSYNTVKHKSNIHFFITPTGVRVGSNCFVEKTDPTTKAACVGNRWINENTKKSYVCNTSGVWTEEDFCEIGCMTMFGSKHVGMRLRTVANSENPMQKYIQDYEDIGGNLALDYSLTVNASTVVTSSPTDPDFYFQAESKDENEGVEFSLPANTKTLQSYRRSLVKSKVYQGGQQFAHWSNCDHTGAILKAYKTFDTSAAGEYIEGSEEEEQ